MGSQTANLIEKNDIKRVPWGDMTPRENALAILHGEQPDFYGNLMETIVMVPDPVMMGELIPQDGQEHPDDWGTIKVWHPGAPGAHPVVNSSNAVITDIENWKEQLKIPSLENLDWSKAIEVANSVDRKEKFVGMLCLTGCFERSHFLMGMEDAFCNYLEYPEEMAELIEAIADYKIAQIRLTKEMVNPDVVFFHDDWGSKQNLFLPPDVWREIIKPQQQRISDTIHELGMLYIHHADCICEPIVTDMVELGIDVWQGSIPQNDLVKIQQITEGKLAMCGGVDGAMLDQDGVTPEQVRAEVHRAIDTYCPGGRFYPATPNTVLYHADNNAVMQEELYNYGRQWAVEHPIVK